MKKRSFFAALIASLLVTAAVQAQEPIPLSSAGGITMYAVAQDSPGEGFNSNKIILKADDASAKIVTFENIAIEGAVQAWGNLIAPPETFYPPVAGATYDASWASMDTHLLISKDMIAGGVYKEFETNDKSLGDAGLPSLLGGAAFAEVGIGPTSTAETTDAFFLDTSFQGSEIDFAQIVSQTDSVPTVTVGLLGEGFIPSGEPGGAFFDAVGVDVSPPGSGYCETATSEFCFDFSTSPAGATIGGNAEWRGTGGLEDGYLKVTDAANGERGVVVIPINDTHSVVAAGRTGGANAAHHIDNLEATVGADRVQISAQLRVGGGTDRPADGFSFSYVPNTDPTTAGDSNGFAGISTEPENLPEEGTTSGISIGFDEWQSGPAPDDMTPSRQWAGDDGSDGTNDGTRDVIGLSLRVDGVILGQAPLSVLNGAADDTQSLQTGPNTNGIDGLGWAELTIDAPTAGARDGHVSLSDVHVTWKGQPVEFIGVPEPASGVLALFSLLGLAGLRRRNG